MLWLLERGKKVNTILDDAYIIYQTVKAPHLKKLQIIQNINNLKLDVSFMFSNLILNSSPHFFVGETGFRKKYCLGSMSNFPMPRG